MLIRRIQVFHVGMELSSPFETSFGVERTRHTVLVRVEESGGEEGWGEAPVSLRPLYGPETVGTAWHALRDFLIPALVGTEVSGPGEFLSRVSRFRGHRMAKAALDGALWDLRSRLEGIPLWRALGGVRERVESGVSVGIQPSVGELLRVVGDYLEAGYVRVKLKIRPGWDLEPLSAVRGEHPDVPLQADANGAYSLRDYPHLRALDRLDLLMLEQPLRPGDLVDHALLARLLRTPICLDESVLSAEDAAAAMRLGACSVLNLKPPRVGGLTEARRVHDLWAGAGLPLWIGGMLETGVGRAHLVAAATLPGVSLPNDVSASDRYFPEDLVDPPWTLGPGGTLEAPSRPGIGVEVLEDRLERYTVKSEEFRR